MRVIRAKRFSTHSKQTNFHILIDWHLAGSFTDNDDEDEHKGIFAIPLFHAINQLIFQGKLFLLYFLVSRDESKDYDNFYVKDRTILKPLENQKKIIFNQELWKTISLKRYTGYVSPSTFDHQLFMFMQSRHRWTPIKIFDSFF